MVELAGKGHVLVVDDDETIVTIVEEILGGAGYETLPAYDGEQALDIFATNKVDLVITDICMDGMDGFELIKRIKLVDSTTNIIVMTGYDSYDTVLKALQHGAYDYLQKPLDNQPSVVAAVQRAFENAKLQQENLDLLVQLRTSHDQLSAANRSLKEANKNAKYEAYYDDEDEPEEEEEFPLGAGGASWA